MEGLNTFNSTTSVYNLLETESILEQKAQGQFDPSEAIVSNEIKEIIENVVDFYIIFLTCLFGVVGNVIAIAVFYRQGYKDTINISLTAIAIWDLIKCACGALYRTRVPVSLILSPSLAITYDTIVSFAFAYPSSFCTYASSVLAAFIAVERCLCVSLPFTVKFLLTPKVVTGLMILLSIISFGSLATNYSVLRMVWVFHPQFNVSVARKSYTATSLDHTAYLRYYNAIGFIWPLLSFAVQCCCTVIIYIHLRRAGKFRAQLGNSAKSENTQKAMSSRDRQVTRMLLVVLLVYIACLFPRIALNVGKSVEQDFYMYRYYHNVFASCFYFVNLFDFANSSVNCIIYYFMSTQFRVSLREMMRLQKKK